MKAEINFLKESSSDELEVLFDHRRCIRAEQCVAQLDNVFRQHQGRMALEEASADSIVKAIEACPSGALRYRRTI